VPGCRLALYGRERLVSREEHTLGSLEVGWAADLAVLNADVFDRNTVPDQAIRRVHSALILPGSKVVHGDPDALRWISIA
jgi:predicted amidohydrolase YtcJ